MIPDYYQVLGVSPNATDSEIREAFLAQATKCHPDRGGTHEAMKRVNEAWEVLSDRERRQRYDRAWSNRQDLEAQAAAENDAKAAARAADQYPPIWSDFVKATYGKHTAFGVTFPTVHDSISGALCIGLGTLLGIVTSIAVVAIWFPQITNQRMSWAGVYAKVVVIPAAAAGAWLGWWIHRGIQLRIVNTPNGKPNSSATDCRILRCPACTAKLRVPVAAQTLSITCPRCKHRFTHDKPIQSEQNKMAYTLRLLLGVHVVTFILQCFTPWPQLLPTELQGMRHIADQDLDVIVEGRAPGFIALFVFVMAFFLVHLASVICLFLLRAWGLWLFAATSALPVLLTPFAGPFVYSGIEMFTDEISMISATAAIVLGFCTNSVRK